MFHFNTPWKRQNVFGFMTFSGGTKMEDCVLKWVDILKTITAGFRLASAHWAITCSKLSIETLEQGVKYVQSLW